MPPEHANAQIEEWFDSIDCDDEEFVRSLATENPSFLVQKYVGAGFDEDIRELGTELLGAIIGPLNPIQYAALVESEDTALVLTDFYSDEELNQKWGQGNTLFHLAAFNGLELLLKKLLKRGLPSTIANKKGFRPMDCVANDATRDVFANFEDDEEPERKDTITESRPKKMVDKTELPKAQPTPKGEEYSNDDSEYEIPEYPPMRKIDPKATPKKSALKSKAGTKKSKVQFEAESTFFDCCRNGELDLVKRFVEQNRISVKASTFLGITTTHMAVESGDLEVVKFLIEKGAPVSAVDADGYSPLHLACSMNHLDIAKFLISKGADVNTPTKEGEYTIELCESKALKAYIEGLPSFDKSIKAIVASKPPREDD